jgi:hypothetical protein
MMTSTVTDARRRSVRAHRPRGERRRTDGEPEDQRDPVAGGADAEGLPPQRPEVDLEACEEQQERQPEDREHLKRQVELDPAEPRGTERDPGDDLHHDGGDP